MPTLSAPANVDVALDVATMLPAIKRPCAVVDASVAEDVAVKFPIEALNAVSTLAVSESIKAAMIRENEANSPLVVDVAETVDDPATSDPIEAVFARVSVDEEKEVNSVVDVAFPNIVLPLKVLMPVHEFVSPKSVVEAALPPVERHVPLIA